MAEARSGLELYLLDYLIGKNTGSKLFHIESLKAKFNVSLDTLTDTLKRLQEEKIITFIGNNHIKVSPDFKNGIQDIIEIYGLVEGLPYYKVEFTYFDKPKLDITTPFESRFKDKINFEVVKEEETVYMQKSPYDLILLFDKFLPKNYIDELKWRFGIEKIGFKEYTPEKAILGDKKPHKIPYFKKQTSPETFISDLYQMINAWLFIEGYLAKSIFKPVSKEELIEAIVDMEGQYVYDCGIVSALKGEVKTEENVDKQIPEVERKIREKLQNKTEEHLWQILEERAKKIIPINREGKVDSMALSSYKEALMLLARRGKFEIEFKGGKRVIGEFKTGKKQ